MIHRWQNIPSVVKVFLHDPENDKTNLVCFPYFYGLQEKNDEIEIYGTRFA